MPRLRLIPLIALVASAVPADEPKVGPTPDGTVVATGQLVRPAGEVVQFNGRPVDLAVTTDGKTAFAKDNRGLVVIDVEKWKVTQELPFPKGTGGGSMHGIAVSKDGKRVFATTANDKLHVAEADQEGQWQVAKTIDLPGPVGKELPDDDDDEGEGPPKDEKKKEKPKPPSHPTGITLFADGKRALVCLSRNNAVAVVDLEKGEQADAVPVGVAPFAVLLNANESVAFVSNWGGRRAKKGDRTAESSGTEVVIDERGIGASGTVGRIDLKGKRMDAEVAVGLHPAGLALAADGQRLFVANANSDTVSILDPAGMKVLHTVTVRPLEGLPFGSGTNAVCLSKDGKTLFAANGGNNAVAVLDVGREGAPQVAGFIPTGWFPGAVAVAGDRLLVANVKGTGSRNEDPKQGGFNSHRHTGTVQKTALPGAAKLAEYTKQVIADARLPQVLAAQEGARLGVKPVPVPARPGEPSVIEHVVYVIKENRTYDQVFGDFADPKVYPKPKGNGEPKLCVFGKEITPNHHALADEFVLLDNFYCNGVLSADGHSWVTEGNVTDHLEKAFGGFTRSYTFGDDPLTYSSSGFLWDNALLRGRRVRNYGELVYTEPKDKTAKFKEIYADYIAKAGKVALEHKLGIAPLWERTCQEYPGWNMEISDQQRVDVFLKELAAAEKKGEWANLTFLYLPQDHTSGTSPNKPTPAAHMADNDLALGRAVEAISNSKFWPRTAIFVVEDDPQDGWDHVDGHRSIGLVISPYTKRKAVVSHFYNQTSVVHTMERILGLPPMNQMDAMSPLMTDCFTDTPDLTAYKARPVTVPLDKLNPEKEKLPAKEKELAELSLKQDFSKPDRVDDEAMNRIIWHAMKGASVPYPAEWAGAHGRGLKGLKLKHQK